jgi:hypothetical protein
MEIHPATEELYNGTSWTIVHQCQLQEDALGGAGTQQQVRFWWNTTPQQQHATEEFTGAFLSTKKITTS